MPETIYTFGQHTVNKNKLNNLEATVIIEEQEFQNKLDVTVSYFLFIYFLFYS